MLKSAPPKNLVKMLTSPNALYFFFTYKIMVPFGMSSNVVVGTIQLAPDPSATILIIASVLYFRL